MSLRIEEKEAFEVFGIEKHFAKGESIPAFWTECYEKGLYQKLLYDLCQGSRPGYGGIQRHRRRQIL